MLALYFYKLLSSRNMAVTETKDTLIRIDLSRKGKEKEAFLQKKVILLPIVK